MMMMMMMIMVMVIRKSVLQHNDTELYVML